MAVGEIGLGRAVFGVYCLHTSQTGPDEAILWNTYTMLTDLEAVFWSLKSELGLRPVYHQIAQRISAINPGWDQL